MRVIIDPDLCQGHLRCYAVSADLFEIDHIGHGVAPDRDLTEDELELARQAAVSCPEGAIKLLE